MLRKITRFRTLIGNLQVRGQSHKKRPMFLILEFDRGIVYLRQVDCGWILEI